MKFAIYYFILFLTGVCLIFYVFFFIIRFYFMVYEGLCYVFPHMNVSEKFFYLKYGKSKQDMTFLEFKQIYCEEFIYFFYTDLTWLKVYYLVLIIFILFVFKVIKIFFDVYFFKIFKFPKDLLEYNYRLFETQLKEKMKTEKICLESNLMNFHDILISFYKNASIVKVVSEEEFANTKRQICFNILELYYILKYNFSEQNIIWLKKEKENMEKKLDEEINEYLIYFLYLIEIKHYTIILESLEKNEVGDIMTKRLLINTKIFRKI